MAIAREVVRALAIILNAVVVVLAVWLLVRAGHLPPDGYAVILGLLLLAPVFAVVALLWPAQRTLNK